MDYRYWVVAFPEQSSAADRLSKHADMERIYFPGWFNLADFTDLVAAHGGTLWGLWYGGMFGLPTNQFIAITTNISAGEFAAEIPGFGPDGIQLRVLENRPMRITVRPTEHRPVDRDGFFVFRFLHLQPGVLDEYIALCLRSWPGFERGGKSQVIGLWEYPDDEPDCELLMLTWYASVPDWDRTRAVDPADAPLWRRRAEFELSHWGIGARRA